MAGNGVVMTDAAGTDQRARRESARREKILEAAATVIAERGFGDTRVAEIAQRAGTSQGLVMYHFGTRERLLVDALVRSEESFYDRTAALLTEAQTLRRQLEIVIAWTCVPSASGVAPGEWGLWLDVWATAFRQAEVARCRLEQDLKWRDLLEALVRDALRSGEVSRPVEPRSFVLTFTALLDGISTQVALQDPEFSPRRAGELAMAYVEKELGWV